MGNISFSTRLQIIYEHQPNRGPKIPPRNACHKQNCEPNKKFALSLLRAKRSSRYLVRGTSYDITRVDLESQSDKTQSPDCSASLLLRSDTTVSCLYFPHLAPTSLHLCITHTRLSFLNCLAYHEAFWGWVPGPLYVAQSVKIHRCNLYHKASDRRLCCMPPAVWWS